MFVNRSFLKKDNVIIDFYSVAVMNLPIKTIKTAGATKPIMGTKTEGKRFENSDDISSFNIFKYFSIYIRNNVNFITG